MYKNAHKHPMNTNKYDHSNPFIATCNTSRYITKGGGKDKTLCLTGNLTVPHSMHALQDNKHEKRRDKSIMQTIARKQNGAY